MNWKKKWFRKKLHPRKRPGRYGPEKRSPENVAQKWLAKSSGQETMVPRVSSRKLLADTWQISQNIAFGLKLLLFFYFATEKDSQMLCSRSRPFSSSWRPMRWGTPASHEVCCIGDIWNLELDRTTHYVEKTLKMHWLIPTAYCANRSCNRCCIWASASFLSFWEGRYHSPDWVVFRDTRDGLSTVGWLRPTMFLNHLLHPVTSF